MQKRLLITLVRSTIGSRKEHKATVRALGLTRRMQTVNRPDHPAVRGMVQAVQHLLHVTEIELPARHRRRRARAAGTGAGSPPPAPALPTAREEEEAP
jgi:large subunit ribosomal protein L30